MSEPKKRFIAGAVCPACSAQDTIKMWDEDGKIGEGRHVRCVVDVAAFLARLG